MKKKVIVFTGAGVSKESGIDTFRDSDGLWMNFKVEEVAHIDGWKKDRQKVLDFYNQRRSDMISKEPNLAHKIISELQNDYNVTVITQNVDNLHERAGSKSVIHLHGELSKVRSSVDPTIILDCSGDVKIGDKCERGSQLRPHITWFGEDLDGGLLLRANNVVSDADVCIIVGTSMQVFPANLIPFKTPQTCLIYYVDPSDREFSIPALREYFFYHIQESATTGVQKVKEELETIFKKS